MTRLLRNFICLLGLAPGVTSGAPLDFDRDVRPILSDRCAACHGPDEKQRQADLRFDLPPERLPASEVKERETVLAPGKPDESEFVRRLFTEDADELMPPPDSGLALTASEKATLKRWIAEGANFRNHWAFVAPVAPELPPVRQGDWCRSEIDYFVLASLEANNVTPAPEADRATLIRRLSLSLTGLPPTPAEVTAFVNDPAPGAYDALVLRLLQSKRYGERMAVDWLDAARYADTSGYQYDWPRTMWRWRDWVIEAFNNNLPYSSFLEWQLAGDLLPNSTPFHAVATGFNRNHGFTIEGGTLDEEYRVQYVNDRVVTMGASMLGLTLECARCHDHKYDPITMRDYYGLFAFFNRLDEKGSVTGKPLFSGPAITTPTADQIQLVARLDAELESLWRELRAPDAAADRAQAQWEPQHQSIWQARATASVTIEDENGAPADPRSIHLEAGRPTYLWWTATPTQAISGLRFTVATRAPQGGSLYALDLWRQTAEGVRRRISAHRAGSSLITGRDSIWALFDDDSGSDWAFGANQREAGTLEFAKPLQLAPGEQLLLRFDVSSPTDADLDLRVDLSSLPEPVRRDPTGRLDELVRRPGGARSPRENDDVLIAYRGNHRIPYRDVYQRILDATAHRRATAKAIPMTMVMRDAIDRETFVLERGAYDQPREKVEAATPSVFPPLPPDAPRNRLGLARWMTAPENPLTARVAVNRVWRLMFGHGLVRTPEDFGSQGESPTHPELLDWLAVDFMRNGWNVKRLIQQLCLSATWRQSSVARVGLEDPENRLLARHTRRRLSAEMLRDNALAIGGLLAERIGGPSVKPYQPGGLWEALTNREEYRQSYERDSGPALYRRGLYVYWKRASHHPVMALFDAPSRETCTLRRPTTNTPLQALALLNETAFVESARALAARMLTDLRFGRDDEARLRHAFLTAASRLPDKLELFTLTRLLASERKVFAADPETARRLLAIGDAPNPGGIDPGELAAFTTTARAILNMSDTLSLP